MADSAAEVGVRTKRRVRIARRWRSPGPRRLWRAAAFLGPALVFLGTIVVYPTIDTVVQSFQTAVDREFVGIENYRRLVDNARILQALKNNFFWVVIAPALITGIGLVFAILTEKVRYAAAIKVIVFMPMAISFLATGVIWRVMYEADPQRGFINSLIDGAHSLFDPTGEYAGARPSQPNRFNRVEGGALRTKARYIPGDVVHLGFVGFTEASIGGEPRPATLPETPEDGLSIVAWRDFSPGGESRRGRIDEGEVGMPGVGIEILSSGGEEIATAVTDANGTVMLEGLDDGSYTVRVVASTFEQGFGGVNWLGPQQVTPVGPTLVTLSIIGAFTWMWAGFAVVVIGAGLSALPRDVIEAAKVDGASEWQTFRYVTVPLLRPVVAVVFITLAINVLKIFDIVLVTAPGAVQDDANVLALEMWKTSFTARQYGLGSAVAVVLFVLVVPIMLLNVQRFRRES